MEMKGCCVAVGSSALHEQGLFAAKRGGYQEGEVILYEIPMVALQSLENRQDVPVCANCFAFVGSTKQHLMLLAGRVDRQGLPEMEVEEGHIPGAVFSPLVPCSMGCGELYCSARCWEDHWAKGHRLLCVGPVPEDQAALHPLVRFKMHAVATNEIFLLVADLVARVITIYEANGRNLPAALQPFQAFVHLPWWDVAINPDPQADAQQFRDLLKGLCVESSSLLREALCQPGLEALFEPHFFGCVIGMFEQNNVGIRHRSPLFDVMDRLQQSGGGGLDPSLLPYAHKAYLPCIESIIQDRQEAEADDGDEEEEGGHVHGANGECGHDHGAPGPAEAEEDDEMAMEEDDEEDEVEVAPEEVGPLLEACRQGREGELFPSLDGTALYALICKMNHSCQPNCRVQYVGGLLQQPLQAQLVALRRIGDGEELCQSYIDETRPFVERQRALADYGFSCSCPRCVAERPANA